MNRKPKQKYIQAVDLAMQLGISPHGTHGELYAELYKRLYRWNGSRWHIIMNAQSRTPRSVSVRLQAHPEISVHVATILQGALEHAGLKLLARSEEQPNGIVWLELAI